MVVSITIGYRIVRAILLAAFFGSVVSANSPSAQGSPLRDQIALTGIMVLGEDTWIHLWNKAGGFSYWLKVGFERDGMLAVAVERDPVAARLVSRGVEFVIELERESVKPLSRSLVIPSRNSDADVSFDAGQILLFERMQQLDPR